VINKCPDRSRYVEIAFTLIKVFDSLRGLRRSGWARKIGHSRVWPARL